MIASASTAAAGPLPPSPNGIEILFVSVAQDEKRV
jgi:hypothetical protein